MRAMLRTWTCAIAVTLLATVGTAQQPFAPMMGAYQFSTGVHPVLSAVFPDADARIVRGFWKGELKDISVKVTDKKELIGSAARIPMASTDTIRILIAIEQRKGEKDVIAQIAFLTRTGYVAPDSPERELTACTEWVRLRSVTLLKQLAQRRMDEGQRKLGVDQRALDMLVRERDRAEASLTRTEQRATDARREKALADSTLAAPYASAASDSADAALEAKEQAKRQRETTKRRDRAAHTVDAMVKKADDLRWSIKKNEEDRARQEATIARQQEVVNGLKRDLDAIR